MISTVQNEQRAVDSFDSGDLTTAESILLDMLKDDPDCLPAHFNLTRVYRRTGEFPLAVFHGRRTLRLNPAERNAALNLGIVFDEMGCVRQAVHYYKRELSQDPYSALTLWNLGHLYFRRNRWRAASDCLQRCFDLRYWHEMDDTVYKLGTCYYKLQKLQKCIDLYEAYVVMAPREGWALNNLGSALLHAKEYKRAILRLRQAFRLNPQGSVAEELARARRCHSRSAKN